MSSCAWLARLALAAVALLAAATAQAQTWQPPAEPIPVIELGMHTGGITALAADRSGRLAVTVSEDKTARVWDIASGRQQLVLRLPQGAGYLGRLYTAAITGDGRLVAVGGWGAPAELRNNSLYLFELPSGRLVRRIGGLPNTVNGLAFSPDDRLLAVALGGGSGLRVYETASGNEFAREAGYAGGLNHVTFSPDGRLLLATGMDGLLHPYSLQGRELGVGAPRALAGRKLGAPRFSPDGRRVAIGYFDSPELTVMDAATFNVLARLQVDPNVRQGSVAWSLDGELLHATTSSFVGSWITVRTWSRNNPAPVRDLRIGTNTPTGLIALPGGRLLFSTLDPSWGLIQPDGRIQNYLPLGADLRLQDGAFTVSADARRVRFSMRMGQRPPQVFDFGAGGLLADDPTMTPPLQQAPGLALQWRGLPRPLLNGRELPQAVQEGDQVRSVAVAADGSRFAMGTDWRVALFDREGRLLWAQQPPSSTWTVALSADGRYLVSGHGDGSIRWRDTSDGREVLALFLHTDGQRWVAWTPEGFFDASPGGEQLIGHHLNRGADRTGDFISAAQLRERYFQPALVSRRLEPAGPVLMGIATRSLGDVRQLLGTQAGQPPQVQLLAADANAGDVNVQVKVNDLGGGLGNLTFYLDGKPMEGRQAGVVTDGTVSRSFSLPPGRYKLEVAASSRGGVEGPRVARDLVVSGAAAPAALHVLSIGVEKYRDTQLELKNSANDATRLGAELSQRAKPLFPRGVNLRVLRDDQASLGGIEAAFAQLRAQFKPEDTLVIFLAGHGESSPRGGYVFLPWDFERGAVGPRGQGLDEARLQAMLASSPRNTLLLIDTCEAGSAQDMVAGAYRRLNGLTQHVLIGASRKGELAREGYNGHGVFTAALLETLARKPEDAGDRQLSVVELSALVEKSVSRIARTMPGYQQRVSGFLGSARFPVVAR